MSTCGDSTQDGAFIQSRRYDSDGKKGTFPIVDCLEIDLSVNTKRTFRMQIWKGEMIAIQRKQEGYKRLSVVHNANERQILRESSNKLGVNI